MLRGIWIIGAMILAFAAPVYAHPEIVIITQNIVSPQILQFVSSSPRINETLAKPPATVILNFSQNLDPGKSTFTVYDPYNTPLATGNVTISGSSMSVKVPPLKTGYAGTYRVEWKASCLCTDTNEQTNSFYFNLQ